MGSGPMHLASRVTELKPSVTVAVAARARELKAQGRDILSFTLGEPDFDTPTVISDAAVASLRAGDTHYMPTLGDLETRGVVARKLREENGLGSDDLPLEAQHVAIGAGGKHVLYSLFHCLVDHTSAGKGEPDELLIPAPAWVSYAPMWRLAGGRVVEIETHAESGFTLDPEKLRAAITPRTRALILNSPSNPTGTQHTEAQLREIASVVHDCRETAPHMLVITDEIYEKIVYGGSEHFSIGSVPEIAARTVTVNGLSKAFAMTGWRIGYAACPGRHGAALIKAMGTLQGQMTTNITSFNYAAIREALTNPSAAEEVELFRSAFARRAELIQSLFRELPMLTYTPVTGAFYLFPDVSPAFGKTSSSGRVINSALDFSEALLEEVGVAVVPGEDFGGVGGRHVRISFACGEAQIREGMRRLGDFLNTLT